MKALLALEDGRIFDCRSFTGPGEAFGEVVFNTSMTGYQEILTDPSYKGQMVTMTYPLIGNYGVNSEDVESDSIQASALIVKEYQGCPSNYRCEQTLADYLRDNNILGVEALDTRALTLHIRKAGSMRAFISTEILNPETLIEKAKAIPDMNGQDLASGVSCSKPYRLVDDSKEHINTDNESLDETIWKSSGKKYTVCAYDYGIKYNIIRCLEKAGCEVIILPGNTPSETVKSMNPHGIFLSNGPGDPEPVTHAVSSIRDLIGFKPIFGICLGHQLLSIALGGSTYKLKFGHRGGNQPVKNLKTQDIEITSQNHGFAVDPDSLKNINLDITHINLNDNTVEGFRHREYPVFGVQYHPEASPGPHDASYLFNDFTKMMEEFKNA